MGVCWVKGVSAFSFPACWETKRENYTPTAASLQKQETFLTPLEQRFSVFIMNTSHDRHHDDFADETHVHRWRSSIRDPYANANGQYDVRKVELMLFVREKHHVQGR
jgi:hypothetical protein